MVELLNCWKCGAPLNDMPLPLSRLAECPKCRAYLHACRLCQFYDPGLTGKCREERAETVRDPETANFCDWFRPRPHAHRPDAAGRAQAAKSRLDGLFGGASDADDAASSDEAARAELDRLFRHRTSLRDCLTWAVPVRAPGRRTHLFLRQFDLPQGRRALVGLAFAHVVSA